MLFNPDFKDILLALSEANVDFLLVGAYAVAAHGHPRATGDLDLWVRPDSKTAPKVYQVLASSVPRCMTLPLRTWRSLEWFFRLALSLRALIS